MTNRNPLPTPSGLLPGLAVLGLLAAACSGEVGGPMPPAMAAAGTPGIPGSGGSGPQAGTTSIPGAGTNPGGGTTGVGGSTSSGTAGQPPAGVGGTTPVGGAGQGGTSPTGCDGELVPNAKRVVRLSTNQLSRSLHSLFGDTLGAQLDFEAKIGPDASEARTFPPLAAGTEGATIIQRHWQTIDLIAKSAGAWTQANLATFTGCGEAPTEDCARAFVTTFAEKAFRGPLTAEESTAIFAVYDEVKALYTTIPEAVNYSVQAILQSPQFLYRRELGTNKDLAEGLTSWELANQLSYFLTDGPPDDALRAAAAANTLTNPAELGAQATRILALPEARKNLGEAMFSYFKLDGLTTVVIDDPGWTFGTMENPYSGVRESSYHEAELFLTNALWNGPLSTLLLGKQAWINAPLAPLYGITTFPPAGATLDADGFAAVMLPDNRAGILTQVAFLASRSRPDIPSVVGRGIAVNDALLCQINPLFPEDEATLAAIAAAKADPAVSSGTERYKAEYRGMTLPCAGCHLQFDAYGLALENYDIIGRYRTMDPQARPIDPTVTLPTPAGGGVAVGAVDMGNQIAASPAFASCVAKNMLAWSLAEGTQLGANSCSTQAIATAFNATDKSFSALLREIAVSQAFMSRKAGVAQ